MMEKMKQVWKAFVHWPGWTGWLHWDGWKKLAAWPGWTAWLKWSGWKRMAAWGGWKKLLFPHTLLVLLCAAASGVGLAWVFLTGRETTVAASLIYALSAYGLVILVAWLVRLLPWVKRKTQADPVYQKLKEKESDGAFGIGLYVEQLINFCYGGFKILSGIVIGSAWIGADGIYNFAQGVIQLYQILRHKKVTTLRDQWKAYRQCGYMMIALHTTMTGLIFQMIHMGRHEESSEIMIIATAAFTFFKLIKSIVEVARDRKHKNPVDSAVYFLDFSQALYNLFVLQVGLLWVFGGSGFAHQKLMNSLTGGAVCLLVVGMGLYMLWRSDRDMKMMEEREVG